MENKFILALKSRTTWTIVALFVIGGVQNITSFIPESIMPIVQSILGLLAVYFKVNTNTDYRD